MAEQKHLYHLVDESPWPILTATSALSLLLSAVMYMHSYKFGLIFFLLAFSALLACMSIWWRDVIREATFEGQHTSVVQKGLRIGMSLFILSEVCFFVSFFWAYFHSSLSPSIHIGAQWPPVGLIPFNPWGIPFLNTLILLLSGASITWVHHAIIGGKRLDATFAFVVTIQLALIFTFIQGYEYLVSYFDVSAGVFGGLFFITTGFHGFHVLIGTFIIIVMLFRLESYQFTKEHHFGFEAGAWYWHFVDIVWLILFISIYWWGSI